MAKFILKFNEAVIKEIPIEKDVVSIGRKEENDIHIDNMAVSGRHAKLVLEGDSHILYDLNSLNGTFVNGVKISKAKLKNNDQIIIGKHTLIFKEEEEEKKRPMISPEELSATGETVILDTRKQRELLAQKPPKAAKAPPAREEKIGVITVISGGSGPREVELTKRLTILGKASDVDIKCSGFFVGKTAAIINRRPNGYFLSYSEGMAKPKVNGKTVEGQIMLKDGDQIEIGGTRMQFYYK